MSVNLDSVPWESMSLAHELSGSGSTGVVRFHASAGQPAEPAVRNSGMFSAAAVLVQNHSGRWFARPLAPVAPRRGRLLKVAAVLKIVLVQL